MTTTLRNLKLHEISLVDAGANPGAKVLLAKRKPVRKEDPTSTDTHVPSANWTSAKTETCRKCGIGVEKGDLYCSNCGVPFHKVSTAKGGDVKLTTASKLRKSARAGLATKGNVDLEKRADATVRAIEKGYSDGQAKTLADALEDQEERELLSSLWDALYSIFNDDTLSEDQQNAMVKASFDQFIAELAEGDDEAAAAATNKNRKKEDVMTLDLSKAAPEVKAHVEKLEASLAAVKAELAKKAEPEGGDPVLKGLTPEAIAEVKKLRDASAAASAEVMKLRDEQTEREFIEKAKGFDALPGADATKLGKILKSVHEKAPEVFKELEPLLKGWNEAIKKSPLFTELGATGGNGAVGSTAFDTAKAKAQALVEKGEAKTIEQGIAQVFKSDKKLYAQHVAERKGN